MRLSTVGWLAILAIFTLTISSCDDDDGGGNNPVIGTLFDNLQELPQFSTLVTALERTGQDALLDRPNTRLTLLAPTNDAFSNAGIDLSAVSDEDLTNILAYHVIGDIVRDNAFADFFEDGTTDINTLNAQGPGGANLPVLLTGMGTFTIDRGATLNPTPVGNTPLGAETVNGIIYSIDRVLMPPSLTDRAVRDGRFTTLVAALQRLGLDDVLDGDGTFTVFAPTDEAFAAAGIDLDEVSDDDLRQILLYHVLSDAIPAGSIPSGQTYVTTMSTAGPNDSPLSLLVDNSDGSVTLNDGVDVIITDVFGTNGVIHAIDEVLITPLDLVDIAVLTEATQTLEDALVRVGLVDALNGEGPFTIFAPTNDAFASLDELIMDLSDDELRELLLNHVVQGNLRADVLMADTLMTLGGSPIQLDSMGGIGILNGGTVNVVSANIQGTNGVVHLIDQVLYDFDVVDQAILADQTQALEDSLITAGLIETLRGDGPFTIFAPTNEAFEVLNSDSLGLSVDQLADLLQGHVVSGLFTAEDLPAGGSLTALNGNIITFNQDLTQIIDGNPNATRTVEIITTDIEATNGVIHLIGSVLLGND